MSHRLPIHVLVALGLSVSCIAHAKADDAPPRLDCKSVDCASVLKGATRFEHAAASAFETGYEADGKLRGWIALSTDVVDVKAYSGKPLVTLIGLTPDGVISGVRVVHHSEPILLVGIPEKALFDFARFYVGKSATAKIVVGATDEPDAEAVDVISGATVTALAQNRTILDTARALGEAVGVVKSRATVAGHFVRSPAVLSWQQMLDAGVFGHLRVTQEQMKQPHSAEPFIELYFTIADAPQIGGALLGQHEYAWMMGRLAPDEHLVVVLGNGSSSFRGSGFVRGGIFDRVRIEQGLRALMFSDRDAERLAQPPAAGAPEFKEAMVFIARKGKLDPGAPFDLVFLGSHYNQRGGFSRDYAAFRSTLRLPPSVYVLDGPDPNASLWKRAWQTGRMRALLLAGYLALIIGVFAGRRFSTGRMQRLKYLHESALLVSFLMLGLFMHAQPSVTQVLTLVGSVVGEFRWGLFLSEPALFISWIFIAVVTVIWGRGVFCGWVCPYGALNELAFKLGRRLKLPAFELPEWLHVRARFARYAVLALLIVTFLGSPTLGEHLAEVEPFKSTFFVLPWTRPLGYFAWWLLLLGLAFVWYRPFCRYLCPLGAALALPSSLRISGPYRRNFCDHCKICTRGCEPRAIRADGVIDPRECLSCMECEANYRDREVCPPLIAAERLTQKPRSEWTAHELDREKTIEHDLRDRRRFLARTKGTS